MQVRGLLALAALAVALALAGCSRADPSIIADSTGGQDTPAGNAGPATVDVAAATDGLQFQQTALTGPADTPIAVNFNNPAALEHNWVLVESGQEQAVADAAKATGGNPAGLDGVIAGGAPIANSSETVQVPPTAAGQYPYICTVPGHYEAGMKGTMTLGATAEGGTGEPADAAPETAVEAASAAAGAADDTAGLTVAADPSGALKFQQATLQAPAGSGFPVNFANSAPLQHNWVLVEPDQAEAVATAAQAKGGDPSGIPGVIAGGKPISNSSETVEVPALEPGTYPYICTVPGHYQAGMVGELTATP